jgi:ubiquitin-activating enzyme E1-like protein 2
MYGLEPPDRVTTLRIAAKVTPALPTTTNVIAGLVVVELLKIVCGLKRPQLHNSFLNLATCTYVTSCPLPPAAMVVREGLTMTVWDRWEVRGGSDYTLNDLIDHLQDKYGVEANMVVQGTRMVYVPFMPGHKKRLTQPLLSLVQVPDGQHHIDFTVSLETESGEDTAAPPVRFYLTDY